MTWVALDRANFQREPKNSSQEAAVVRAIVLHHVVHMLLSLCSRLSRNLPLSRPAQGAEPVLADVGHNVADYVVCHDLLSTATKIPVFFHTFLACAQASASVANFFLLQINFILLPFRVLFEVPAAA